MTIINIEQGHPTVDQAIERLTNGLYRVRASGVPCAKVIHGYGSTGTGGAIKAALPRALRDLQSRRLIKGYIRGEDFGPYSVAARDLASGMKQIKSDPDWGRNNDGITIVLFK
ncbi:MAG: Smr/MutS family protein [Clostridiales bacterium]|nr:Smr/MutS family protein [Clostridiales bacterium]